MRNAIIAVALALVLSACTVSRIDVQAYAGWKVKSKPNTTLQTDCRVCTGVVVSIWTE